MHFMHVKQTASLHDTATYKIKSLYFLRMMMVLLMMIIITVGNLLIEIQILL